MRLQSNVNSSEQAAEGSSCGERTVSPALVLAELLAGSAASIVGSMGSDPSLLDAEAGAGAAADSDADAEVEAEAAS